MMIPSELLSIIGRRHFIAEIHTETATQAIGVVEALARGGILVFEISLAIPGAEEILRHYVNNPDLMVGAGGVLDARQAVEAATAGARFITSPIMAPELVPICAEHHITPIMGALTPTEIIAAQRAGAEMVKVFPVSAMGGRPYVRSLFRQFSHLSIMVSGGISMENLPDYLALPVRAIALGSVLAPRTLIEHGDWAAMTSIARRFVDYAIAWEASAGGATPRLVTSARPTIPDTVMAPMLQPPYHQSQPQAQPPTPLYHPSEISQPRNPAAASQPPYPARSQPPQPPVRSEPPAADSTPSFKPWDSKPVPPGPGEDWIN